MMQQPNRSQYPRIVDGYQKHTDRLLTPDPLQLRYVAGEIFCGLIVPQLAKIMDDAAEKLVIGLGWAQPNELTKAIAGERLMADLVGFLTMTEGERGDSLPMIALTEAAARDLQSYPTLEEWRSEEENEKSDD